MSFETLFGTLEIEPEEIIHFKQGLFGFEDLHDFTVVNNSDTFPIFWLASLEDSKVGFPIVNPYDVLKNYEFTINKDTLEELEAKSPEELYIFNILTLNDKTNVNINLLAPIIISKTNKKGLQYVISDTPYNIKNNLMEILQNVLTK